MVLNFPVTRYLKLVGGGEFIVTWEISLPSSPSNLRYPLTTDDYQLIFDLHSMKNIERKKCFSCVVLKSLHEGAAGMGRGASKIKLPGRFSISIR